tara:strand:+ start:43 stop:609 length:567 start_codon:yes stop_codon:yes gene_type:complete
MNDFKTMKIHGKEYVMVDERIRRFWELHPNGRIETILCVDIEYLSYLGLGMKAEQSSIFLVRAVVTPDVGDENRYVTGQAYEVEGSSNVNDGSALENCETSAVGRALGILGIGLIGGVASAEEVSNAVSNGSPKPASDAQRNFISSLRANIDPDQLEEVDSKIMDLVDDSEAPTSQEASSVIEYLQGR